MKPDTLSLLMRSVVGSRSSRVPQLCSRQTILGTRDPDTNSEYMVSIRRYRCAARRSSSIGRGERSSSRVGPVTPETSAIGDALLANLERLAVLHRNGDIADAAFRITKARLLSDTPAPPAPGVAGSLILGDTINRQPGKTGYEHLPEFWHAYLASRVGNHLHGQQHPDQLADDYERFLASPGCSSTLREVIPGPVRRKNT
jgi:hypothetical protein